MISPTPGSTPVSIGPTWQRDKKSKWLLPEHTLGWQVLGWTADYLRQPDGPDAGHPWRYTDEQARFILWWYAVDARGQFVYRYGMLRRVKGWGLSARTPLVRRFARLSLSALAGLMAGTRPASPSRFTIPLLGC